MHLSFQISNTPPVYKWVHFGESLLLRIYAWVIGVGLATSEQCFTRMCFSRPCFVDAWCSQRSQLNPELLFIFRCFTFICRLSTLWAHVSKSHSIHLLKLPSWSWMIWLFKSFTVRPSKLQKAHMNRLLLRWKVKLWILGKYVQNKFFFINDPSW